MRLKRPLSSAGIDEFMALVQEGHAWVHADIVDALRSSDLTANDRDRFTKWLKDRTLSSLEREINNPHWAEPPAYYLVNDIDYSTNQLTKMALVNANDALGRLRTIYDEILVINQDPRKNAAPLTMLLTGGYCVMCQTRISAESSLVLKRPPSLAQRVPFLFAGYDQESREAVSRWIQANHGMRASTAGTLSMVACICSNDSYTCVVCGRRLHPSFNETEVMSMYTTRQCSVCGGGALSKFEAPKLKRKDLKRLQEVVRRFKQAA